MQDIFGLKPHWADCSCSLLGSFFKFLETDLLLAFLTHFVIWWRNRLYWLWLPILGFAIHFWKRMALFGQAVSSLFVIRWNFMIVLVYSRSGARWLTISMIVLATLSTNLFAETFFFNALSRWFKLNEKFGELSVSICFSIFP